MAVLTHGTLGGYTNHACRCHLCKAAATAYQKALHAKRREAGECQVCSRPSAPFNRCFKHRLVQAAKTKRYQLRKKTEGVSHVTA